jgi:hypothetical protein
MSSIVREPDDLCVATKVRRERAAASATGAADTRRNGRTVQPSHRAGPAASQRTRSLSMLRHIGRPPVCLGLAPARPALVPALELRRAQVRRGGGPPTGRGYLGVDMTRRADARPHRGARRWRRVPTALLGRPGVAASRRRRTDPGYRARQRRGRAFHIAETTSAC